MRPVDLARPHGLSSQAIRTYEDRGILPPAERSASGHRRYGERHVHALAAFRALAPAIGYGPATDVVGAAHRGEVDTLLTLLDRAHRTLADDRTALELVGAALDGRDPGPSAGPSQRPSTIGQVARRIGVTPATLRIWEEAGVLRPDREEHTGRRLYGATDLRDAHLARQLRHGRYPLRQIAVILDEVRAHRSPAALRQAIAQWREDLRDRGLGLLRGEAAIHELLEADETSPAAGRLPA